MFAGLSCEDGRRFNSKGISIADIMDRSNNLFQMVCRFASSDELDWGSGFYEPTKLELKLIVSLVSQSAQHFSIAYAAGLRAAAL